MIRRSQPPGLLLISQVDHATLAGMICESWGNDQTESLSDAEALRVAAYRHDDGWSTWEARPKIDPQSGQPYDFLEMPLDDSIEIWSRSIERCFQSDPRAGTFASLHFCDLAQSAVERRTGQHGEAADTSDKQIVADLEFFLNDQATRRRTWVASSLPPSQTADGWITECEWGFRWLRFFDRLSLWLCCEPPAEPRELVAPDGTPYTIAFRSEFEAGMTPWPFDGRWLLLDAPAKRTSQSAWRSQAEFDADYASAEDIRLEWTLFDPS